MTVHATRAREGGALGRAGGALGRERAWRTGLLIGAAAGIAAGYVGRRAERITRDGLVDWRTAERLAAERLGRAPGALPEREIAAAEPAYAEIMARIVPLLEARLHEPLPGVVERFAVVGRAGWASANAATFRSLVRRLEEPLLAEVRRRPGALAGIATLADRYVTTRQIGFLLGYLGTRVLGQYDIALLAAEEVPGRLLFVEENIRATATQLEVPLERMRLWIALHETTHAFEFEAHPWLRPYLAERLERQLTALLDEAEGLRTEGLIRLLRRVRRPQGGDLLSAFMTAEQRRVLRETQVVMSLLEGFGDWIMDDVGAQVLPDVAAIRARFEARRSARRSGLDRLLGRVLGLDLKLEQYRRGERFVAGVHALSGENGLAQLWRGPETLPDERELADPSRWVRRVMTHAADG